MLQFETVLANSVFFEEENLLFVKLKPEPVLTVDLVRTSFEQTYSHLGDRAVKVIMDSRPLEFAHIPKEVLEYMGNSPYNKYQQSSAIIISGIGQKLIANFYLKVVKPAVLTKTFNTMDGALEWQGASKRFQGWPQ